MNLQLILVPNCLPNNVFSGLVITANSVMVILMMYVPSRNVDANLVSMMI